MRLLNVKSLAFGEFFGKERPKYAIASHRWIGDTEVTFKDVQKKRNIKKKGYLKVKGFADYVKRQVPGLEWLWVDTCCINKESSTELSEAINSMYKWYSEADICLVYLEDVRDSTRFHNSVWFRRGWTLQELLAPTTVVFLTETWELIGHKGSRRRGEHGLETQVGPSIEIDIVAVTRIPRLVLNDSREIEGFTIEEKLAWAAGRVTTREEDMSYCLLGILGISMAILYGEGPKKARQRLLKEAHEASQPPARGPRPFLISPSSNIPFRRDPDFIDRGELMERIHDRLALPAARVALVGLAGVGKSQLAIEYTHRMRASSSTTWVFWIHASSVARFEQGMRNMADEAKIEGRHDSQVNHANLVHDWLCNSANGRWMVVLDGVDDSGFLVERSMASEQAGGRFETQLPLINYLPIRDHGSILVTSRRKSAALNLVERSDMFTVDPMEKGAASGLLKRKLLEQEDEDTILELAEALGGIPLAITQAAAYINSSERRCSSRQYIAAVRRSDRSKQSIFYFDARDLRRDREACNSIVLALRVSIEQIDRERPSAAELLALMSLCAEHAIPEALVWTQSNEEDCHEGVESHTSSGSKPADGVGTDDEHEGDDGEDDVEHERFATPEANSSDEFDKDIAVLRDYFFVSTAKDTSAFQVLGLVQLATRLWLESRGQLERWRAKYIDSLYASLPPYVEYESNELCRLWLPHAMSAASFNVQATKSSLRWAFVMYKAAGCALQVGLPKIAEEMAVRSLEIRTANLPKEHHCIVSGMEMVAVASQEIGKWDKALKLEKQVVELREMVRGAEHPNTLTSMGHIAIMHMLIERWLTSIGHLATMYMLIERWHEAEQINQMVLERRRNIHGDENATLTSMNNVVLTHIHFGRLDEAKELQCQVLRRCESELGGEHSTTLASYAGFAMIHMHQGIFVHAEDLNMRAMEGRRKLLGPRHPDTLTSMNNLAGIYWQTTRWQEAEQLEREVLETRKQVLGAEHPYTIESMANVAQALKSQDSVNFAEAMLRDCMSLLSGLGIQYVEMLERKSESREWHFQMI